MDKKFANPAPLGLAAFGMTTILLNLHNAGFFPLGTMILAMGIFYGGFAQIIAGIMEWRLGNTFGTVAFLSYGLFWETLVFLLIMSHLGWWAGPAKGAIVAYLVMWGIFTFLMWIALLVAKHKWDLQLVFITLWILFFLLAIGDATGNPMIKKFAGYEGLVCGGLALYVAFSQIIGEMRQAQLQKA